jgi:galactokinase
MSLQNVERRSDGERLDALARAFREAFGAHAPEFIARAPGRVNLIGEHTDYNGLPVFPMALQRDIAIVFRARDDALVRLTDVDARYGRREFTIEDSIAPFPRGERGDWGNYAKCAAQALRQRFHIARGIDAAIHGDIPSAAGLSSSSAMVVALTLALVHANALDVERTELMSLTAEAERYVGTQSGGMDQAISLGGRRGEAALIEFEPLRLTHVRVPPSWRFVIANTLVRAEKSGAAQKAYNERTRECRAALKQFTEHPAAREIARAMSHANRSIRYVDLVRDVPLESLLELANDALSEPFRQRFRHVVSEGKRVEAARTAMLASDVERFGALMSASHASLRVDYEVSCPELDRLTDVARGAGAHGARLTGAGFGGCIVALCEVDRVVSLSGALRAELRRSHADLPDDVVLIAQPSDGARVMRARRARA